MSASPRARRSAALIATCMLAIAGAAIVSCGPPPGTWQSRTASSFARQEVSFVYSPPTKTFLLGGGRSTVQESYDPQTDTWRTVAPLPAALDHIQSVELNGLVYYIGGLLSWPAPASRAVYVYDPARNVFATKAPMPAGRERGAGGIAVYNGKIYVAGGLHSGVAVRWFDVYDPASNTWSTLPDMPRARDHFHAAVVGNRLYAIGGRQTSINATITANDAFDFDGRTWVQNLAPLPTARGGFATVVVGSRIFVVGGEGGGHTFDTVESYDVSANAWKSWAAMPTPRHGIQAAVCNGGVYVAAGGRQQGGGQPTAVFEVFFGGEVATCP
jgi:N-acetylneuraminic acid mutarotase